jgi:uncharacterized membrane protein
MKAQDRFPSEWLAVLTHFYRAEVQRSTDWRKRLDTTTNWAIIATTATFSWSFGAQGPESHIIFLFTQLTVFLLLCIEARRYRYFDVWRTRVRMLEVHLMVPALNPDLDILQGDWRTVLSNDLLLPSYRISFWEAAARRLQSNYIWLFMGLLGGWLLRIYTGAPREPGEPVSLEALYQAARYEAITPLEVFLAQGAFWALILTILIGTWRARNVTGEIRRRDPRAKQWPI